MQMNPQLAHRLRVGRDAALRALTRQRAHLWRASRSLRRLGPGRLSGVVDEVEVRVEGTTVQGWAGLPGRAPVAILVSVDGEVAAASVTRGRSDDRAVVGQGREDQRWSVAIERGEVRAGVRRVGAWALFDDGLVEELRPITVTVDEPVFGPGMTDRPLSGLALRAPTAVVSGWLLPDGGYDRVEVRLGQRPAQRARIMAVPRPDVGALAPEAGAPLAGWELVVDIPDVDQATRVELRVDAVGPAGRLALGRLALDVHPRTPVPVNDPERQRVLEARIELVTRGAPSPDTLHLVVATHHLGLGGGQLYLQELLRHLLQREDVSCTVLSAADGVLRAELEQLGARVHIVGQVPLEGLQYESRMLELATLLAGPGATCVLANTSGAFWGVDLADRLGVPSIWAIHESFTFEQFLLVGFGGVDDHVRERFLAAVRTATALVFEADATRRLYAQAAAPGRCIRIDYGVDLDRIALVRSTRDHKAVRERLGVPSDATLLLCLGTFEPRKSQGALALAFSRVAAVHPEAILALVGDQPSAYADAVHAIVDRLQLGERIRIEPVTPDIDDWYLAADGFILGSDVESLPRSMLEVMAYGVPVLGSAVFGIPELLTDGKTGLLFEPACLGALTHVLERFLSMSVNERRAIGERGRSLIEATRPARFYREAYSALLDAVVEDPSVLPAAVLGDR